MSPMRQGLTVMCLNVRQRFLSSAAARSPRARRSLNRAFVVRVSTSRARSGLPFRAADRDAYVDADADVAPVGQRGHAVGGCLVQGGTYSRAAVMSGVEPGSASETHGGVPSRGGQELDVPAEALVLLAEPQIVAVVPGARDAIALDEHALEDHMAHLLAAAAVQHTVQVWCLSGEDVDTLVGVAVAGGLRDACIAGQAVQCNCARGTSAVPGPLGGTCPRPATRVGC